MRLFLICNGSIYKMKTDQLSFTNQNGSPYEVSEDAVNSSGTIAGAVIES